MFLTCLCPTYRRPRLVGQTIVLFQKQDYPPELRFLLILDDSGSVPNMEGENFRVISVTKRFPSLPEKYNYMLDLIPAETEGIVVWDDDDIYLSRHLRAVAMSLEERDWCHPSRVYSVYNGFNVENAAGRFHAAMAARLDAIRELGGWFPTRRADFDQLMLARLQNAFGSPADSSLHFGPTYVFVWENRMWHAQWFMKSPDDTTWYDEIAEKTRGNPDRFELGLLPTYSEILEHFERESTFLGRR